jgi:hypothetical protein
MEDIGPAASGISATIVAQRKPKECIMSLHLVRSHTLMKSSLKAVAAAVMLSALAATPVLAQAAIQEPGAFAFYYPNLDVLNGGSGALRPPAADLAPTL